VSEEYRRRLVDDELDELLPALAAVSLEGPKGVGKTATALQRARSVLALDDPSERELLLADPERLDRMDGPILIDEWQRLPASWDLVRRRVDKSTSGGRYLLTGSAAPVEAPTHTGAGRIVQVRMRPMSLAERGLQPPTVRLSTLLAGGRAALDGDCLLRAPDYAAEVVRSGFPGIRDLPDRARRAQLDGYLARIIERDFADQGRAIRRPETLRRWLAAYAAATSTTTAYNAILDAATPGEDDKPAKTTTLAFRDILSQLWMLDPVPGWMPVRNELARLAVAPKHHLADPALAARLLRLDADALIAGTGTAPRRPAFGALFESLVTLSVRVYAQLVEASVHHLRTRNGDHEVDLVVEGPDGRVVALEVKLAPGVDDRDVAHLRWLRRELGENLADSAVITTGPHAYRRPDGIAVIPAALLGP
jgi:uncharacterized protein